MDVIQNELNRVAQNWNVHRIRPSSNAESPPGRSDVLYFVPESLDTRHYITPVNGDEIEIADEMCATEPLTKGCSAHFRELAEVVVADEGLQTPVTANEAVHLYNERRSRNASRIGNRPRKSQRNPQRKSQRNPQCKSQPKEKRVEKRCPFRGTVESGPISMSIGVDRNYVVSSWTTNFARQCGRKNGVEL